MKSEAIALCRVSSPEQRLSNSLTRQEQNVNRKADELNVEIIKIWSGDVSSKSGKNINRKDLLQMLDYCKARRSIKFLIVDEVDRFMRSIKELYFWEVTFENIGVQVIYASQNINDKSMSSSISKTFSALQAEMSNNERKDKSVNGLQAKVLAGYYPFPVRPGYKTSNVPGLHIPDENRYDLLKEAFLNIAYGKMDRHEALNNLNQKGYKTLSGKKLRADKFLKILMDDYYAGLVSINKWDDKFQKIKGQHVSMINVQEHEMVLSKLTNRRKASRQNHNPEFPMSNLFVCSCGGGFTGNGKGRYYAKYRCRKCNKQVNREEAHAGIEALLDATRMNQKYQSSLEFALREVWKEEEKQNLDYIRNLEIRIQKNKDKIDSLVLSLPDNLDLSIEINDAINKIKKENLDLEKQIENMQKLLDGDLLEFINFSLQFINNKGKNWWEINFEDRQKCKQLVFPDDISFDFSKRVCTAQISPILNLKPNKKDSENTSESLLVELVGVEPTSESKTKTILAIIFEIVVPDK